jgi:folate-binding protein YgfZ
MDGYDAARGQAGLITRTDVGRLTVSGPDRRSYLHGLLTNDVEALKEGQGCYAAYLTAQGRMIADLYVYELGDVVLLAVPRSVKDIVLAKLDQFVFSEDVQLGDVTDAFDAVTVVGPSAGDVCATVLGDGAERFTGLATHENRRGLFHGRPVIVIRVDDGGVPGFELLVETVLGVELRQQLRAAGATDVDERAAEALRIEGGVPRFGRDMFDDTIPLEAGIEGRAISMTKGCYVGQEVIVRVLHRGHGRLVKRLVGLALDTDNVPPSGTPVEHGGREVGRVTSSTWSPALGRGIALAYLHRDVVAPGTAVEVGGSKAEVVSLPFVGASG